MQTNKIIKDIIIDMVTIEGDSDFLGRTQAAFSCLINIESGDGMTVYSYYNIICFVDD